MPDHVTPRKILPYPDAFNGPIGSATPTYGSQDIEELAKALDELNEGHVDFFQPGVGYRGELNFGGFKVNAATGSLSSSQGATGSAWGPDPVLGSGALMRARLTNQTFTNLVPPRLPASGKFVAVCLELTPTTWSAAPTLSVASGPEKATREEAEENLPGTTAGKVRLRWCVLTLTGGSYKLVAEGESASAFGPTGSTWPVGSAAGSGIGSGIVGRAAPISLARVGSGFFEPDMPQTVSPRGSGAVCGRPVHVRFSVTDPRGFSPQVVVGSAGAPRSGRSEQIGRERGLQGPRNETKTMVFIVPRGRRWGFTPYSEAGQTLTFFPPAPTLDTLEHGTGSPREVGEGEGWKKLGWCSNKGQWWSSNTFGWVQKNSGGETSGMYWTARNFKQACVSVKMTNEAVAGYVAVWLATNPTAVNKEGVRHKFTHVSGETWEARLEKWVGGVETLLASTNVTFSPGKENFLQLAWRPTGEGPGPWAITGYYNATQISHVTNAPESGEVAVGLEGGGASGNSQFGEIIFRANENGNPTFDWTYTVL